MVWAVDLGVQIADVGRSLYIGSFCPAMTSLSRYLQEAGFSISISSSAFIFLWMFSRCIMDIVSSIVFIPCPSLRTCSDYIRWTVQTTKFLIGERSPRHLKSSNFSRNSNFNWVKTRYQHIITTLYPLLMHNGWLSVRYFSNQHWLTDQYQPGVQWNAANYKSVFGITF